MVKSDSFFLSFFLQMFKQDGDYIFSRPELAVYNIRELLDEEVDFAFF